MHKPILEDLSISDFELTINFEIYFWMRKIFEFFEYKPHFSDVKMP